jgi:cell wall-associated NlpC family hydrolase
MIRTAGKILGVVVAACAFVLCALAGGASAVATNNPSPLATGSIPANLLVLFQQASAASPCGVPWTLLAAVAKTESSFDATAVSTAGAEGMFQFEPATFGEYAKPTPSGGAVPPTPFDPTDAAYAAARYLCSLGVAQNPTLALVAYNCGNAGAVCQAASAGYAEQVLATAASYTAAGAGVPSGVQAAVVAYAESQIGTPYVYGGDTPGTGFDCSGLVVWAYGLAGVVVPRVANDQWHDEPHVDLNALVPGDLVFFGTGNVAGSTASGESVADHVGIYIGNSAMVDAPHTGADVRVDIFPDVAGAAWGDSEIVLGAADPVAT